MFGRERLLQLRALAIRRHVWFRALTRVDRVLVDLTIRVAGTVRSSALMRSLRVVVEKLEEAFSNRLSIVVKTVGVPQARRLSLIARKWGYRRAREWASDDGFVRFLGVLSLNNPLRVWNGSE